MHKPFGREQTEMPTPPVWAYAVPVFFFYNIIPPDMALATGVVLDIVDML